MNRRLKESLRSAFDAPPPKRKDEFLLSLNYPKISKPAFLLTQAGYIRKRVWVVSFLSVVPALAFLFTRVNENLLDFVWVLSSFIPFIALAGMTEIARSVSHNMAEMEMSCKYSFSDVALARIVILGTADVVMFVIIVSLLKMASGVSAARLAVYLLAPFLLTCSLSLFAFNRLRSKESLYICGGISCFAGVANALLYNLRAAVFSDGYANYWAAAFAALLVWTAHEVIKFIRKTGDFQWNLSLTD
jgi:hypothetical protein